MEPEERGEKLAGQGRTKVKIQAEIAPACGESSRCE